MPETSVKFERALSGPNEVFAPEGGAFPHYRPVLGEMEKMGAGEGDRRVRRAHGRMLEEQRRVGIPDGDRTHPIDYSPRIIPAADWGALVRGLSQRMLAINEWLRRLEAGEDEVVPREIIESSALYDASIPTRFGSVPNRQIGFEMVAVAGGGGVEGLVPRAHPHKPVG